MNAGEVRTRGGLRTGRYLLALAIGIVTTVLLLAVAAALFAAGRISYESAAEIVTTVNFIGAAVTAVIAAAGKGGGVITTGLIAGIMFMAIVIAVGLVYGHGTVEAPECARIAICSVCGGMFGGVLCLRRGNKKLHSKRSKKS